METLMTTIAPELATRVASALAGAAGVEGAIICSADGDVLGAATPGNATQEAALATFVATRAEVLSADGDLRGMGRLVSASRLQQVTASWPGGEALVMTIAECRAFVGLRRGVSAESVAPSLRTILRRYS